MIFCNPTPIALACYLSRELVEDIIRNFIHAVIDLAELGHSLAIGLGVCTVLIENRNLKYRFQEAFVKNLNQTAFEKEMRLSDKATKEHWTEDYKDKWGKSSLNKMLKEPDEGRSR
jgi:hypothetical protein